MIAREISTCSSSNIADHNIFGGHPHITSSSRGGGGLPHWWRLMTRGRGYRPHWWRHQDRNPVNNVLALS